MVVATSPALKAIGETYPVADFKRRPSTVSELTRAKAFLSEHLANFRELPWNVQIELGDGIQYIVDCKAQAMRAVDESGTEPDCSIAIAAADFLLVATGGIDPRTLIFFHRIKMTGLPVAITKFLDAVGNRKVASTMRTDKALPQPTTDYELAKAQIREFGYCMIKDALSPSEVRTLRERLEEQAAAERENGLALRGTATKVGVPPIQPVWNLANKGQVFIDLLSHPLVDEFGIDFLGEYFLISSYCSKIAHPGCAPQPIHTDQIGMHPPVTHMSLGLNIFFFLDDFVEANGATRLVPGSHLPENNIAPDNLFSIEGTIPAEAPAGTAFIFDMRLWHCTGPNKTNKDRRAVFMLMARSWIRTVENHTLSIRPEVLEKMPDRLKTLFGFRTTSAAGGVDGAVEGEIANRDFASRVGVLRPKNP